MGGQGREERGGKGRRGKGRGGKGMERAMSPPLFGGSLRLWVHHLQQYIVQNSNNNKITFPITALRDNVRKRFIINNK